MATTTPLSAFRLPLSPSFYQLPLDLRVSSSIQDSLASRFSSVHGTRISLSEVSIAAESRRVPNTSGDMLDAKFTHVSPLLLSRNDAFNSPLKTHLFCFSSSNGSSPLSQPRAAIILPGLGNNSADYLNLQATLEGYGITSVIANVSRIDWLRNAAGLLDTNYWKGSLRPRPVLDWYLKRVDDAVRQTKELFPGRTVSLIGHSAGGWLARVYMEEFGASHISLLLTLGTPHTPPPKGVSGVVDQTRGLLDYVQEHCAKAVYTPDLKYVCIAGRYILGARIFNESSQVIDDIASANNDQEVVGVATASDRTLSTSTTAMFRARFVGQGYKQVCGRADVWGDGVVPEESAYLEGALNIGIEGIYHSPVGSDDVSRPWYGSPAVVEQWIDHLLR